ncbi:MAG TPA: IS1380 family transposase [Pyrinomonadaceae bacterium]|nr:IS1380 family transposase [Pyrinomonadaceae bacterium]
MSKLQQNLLPIKLEQSHERLTSLTGLVVVEELGRAKGLWARVDELFERPGSGRGYKASEYLRPLMWLLHAGGRRLEDVRELRAEQGVLAQMGLERLPSTDAIGDWLRRQGAGGGVRAAQQLNKELVWSYLESLPEEITVDPDATIIEAHKREAEWTYEKVKGYQPMLAYVNEVCIHHEFRAGNEPAGARAFEFIRAYERKLPPGKQFYLRSDSAYYQAEVINHYSAGGRTFSITADKDCAVKEAISQIKEAQWQKFALKNGIVTDREIAETVHCLEHSKQAFRLLVLRWPNPRPSLFEATPYCYHAVATNRAPNASEIIWEHNQRGESENWHKELKLGFGMEQLPCGQFAANALFFAIGVLAYNLSVLLKVEVLPEEYRHSTVQTLRWQLYRLAAKLVRHGRQWILKVRTDSEKLALLLAVRKKCYELS